MKNVNDTHQEKLSTAERFGLAITSKIGTMPFFLAIVVWTAAWLLWNTLAPDSLRFDPAPNFLMWLFFSNLIQIFLMPLLMIGQNAQSKHAELLAENDFEINKKAELEIQELKAQVAYLIKLVEAQNKA